MQNRTQSYYQGEYPVKTRWPEFAAIEQKQQGILYTVQYIKL